MTRIECIGEKLYKFKPPPSEAASRATAEFLFRQGKDADDLGDMDAAVEFYQKTLSYDPCSTASLVNLGTIWFNRRDFVGAEEYYRKALEVDPNYALAHYNLAGLLQDRRSFQEAAEHYLEAITISPQYADAHYMLATVWEELHEPQLAVKHYLLYLRHRDNDDPIFPDFARRQIGRLQGLSIVTKPAVSATSDGESDANTAQG